MSYTGGSRNFGFGRSLSYAGFNAIRAVHHGGCYGTVSAHGQRWSKFAKFCQQHGVFDARDITLSIVSQYAEELTKGVAQGVMAASYAQNLVSTVNSTLAALGADKSLRACPSSVGVRQRVRFEPPTGYDDDDVGEAAMRLRKQGHDRAAAAIALARYFGLRKREALLLDLTDAMREMKEFSAIVVRRGTKGGRGNNIARLVPTSYMGRWYLGFAASVARDSRCLVPVTMTLEKFTRHIDGVAGRALKAEGIACFRDLRAAFACDRYRALTGQLAPVFAPEASVSPELDLAARETISQELGHGRVDVVDAYIGAWR